MIHDGGVGPKIYNGKKLLFQKKCLKNGNLT